MKGYIFLCDDNTCLECLEKGLFGTSEKNCNIFKNIKKSEDLLFLFNRSKNILYGIWEATSEVGLIDGNAWDGRFKCQVKVKRLTCELLSIDKLHLKNALYIDPYKNNPLSEEKLKDLLVYLFNLRSPIIRR